MGVYRLMPAPGTAPYARRLDRRRLWTGGAWTALACAVVAAAAFLTVREILDLPILGVIVYGGVIEPHLFVYALGGVAAAFAATALMLLLLRGSARPFPYFRWIVGLCLALVAMMPVFAAGDAATGLATAAANVIVGLTAWAGVVLAARAAVRE
ncbi:hypothetical protein Afil01_00680 [Actinorhabdospora filicis]|uniref:Uncharacterized protein n=1 Tax=Actinorhabdospora filicis TaxID=1785913 RepID=A0A9W6W791_9ACTN|nr:hypothetical protein [Actinorhabdospora filicis]GLZ75261.1 hypothetical protein Afil01_00680 [Actinorhabdospora filicis]